MSGLISSGILMLICAELMPALKFVPDAALGSERTRGESRGWG